MELEIVAGTYDSSIIGCSIDLLQRTEELVIRKKYHERGHVGCVKCIASGGHYLASGGTDEAIKLYDLRKHFDVGTLLHHEGSITFLVFYKSTILLSASEDGTICVWQCGGDWDCLQTLTGHKYAVTCVSVHPSGKLALSTGKDRTVRTWNLSTGKAAFTLRLPKAADLVSWSPVGDHYVLTTGASVTVYSLESGESTATFQSRKPISAVQFVQDTVLATGGEDPTITLYSISSGQPVAILKGHSSRVKGLSLSPDNKLLFSASSDGAIKAWSLPKALEDSKCISSVDTGSRLTCITAVLPDDLSLSAAESHPEKKRKRSKKRSLEMAESSKDTESPNAGNKKRTITTGSEDVKPSMTEEATSVEAKKRPKKKMAASKGRKNRLHIANKT